MFRLELTTFCPSFRKQLGLKYKYQYGAMSPLGPSLSREKLIYKSDSSPLPNSSVLHHCMATILKVWYVIHHYAYSPCLDDFINGTAILSISVFLVALYLFI